MSVVLSAQSNPVEQKRVIPKFKDRINMEVDKTQKGIKSTDEGTLHIKNSAKADSIYVYNHYNDEWKNSDGNLIMREMPKYPADSFVLSELETSYLMDENNSFEKYMKQLIEYDDEGRITRMETQFWFENNWRPEYLETMEFYPDGTEKKYEYYSYYESNWIMIFGFRTQIEFNEDNMVISKTIEYFSDYDKEWVPNYKTDYYYGENYSDVTLTYSYFDSYELNDWYPEYKEHFILNENREWESGVGYFWDWENENWIPEIKFTQLAWHNFAKLQYTYLEAQINNDINDWKLPSENKKDDVSWVNYIKLIVEFDELDRHIYSEVYYWYNEGDDEGFNNEWMLSIRYIAEFDHLGNIFKKIFEAYVAEDEYEIFSGMFVDFIYNEDNSISSYVINYYYSDWKGFEPALEYEYFYYSEDTNLTPDITVDKITIYPNPASSVIYISSENLNEQYKLTIFNLSGQIVYNSEISQYGNPEAIDVNFLKSGCYIIQLQNKNRTLNSRFIKN